MIVAGRPAIAPLLPRPINDTSCCSLAAAWPRSLGRSGQPRVVSTGSLRTQSARHRVNHGTIWGRSWPNSGHCKLLYACVDRRKFVAPAPVASRIFSNDTGIVRCRTFLRNHAHAIAAIDLCVVPTLTFECLFAFLVVGHGRRQLLWFAVTRHPTADWLAQQIVEAFPWGTAPTYLVRDNDRAYGQAFTSRVRTMGIRDRPISPRSPWQNAYVERLIGTLRRECSDHVLIYGERHLRRILTLYSLYYNETRTHLGLGNDTPLRRSVQRSGTIIVKPILSGLHHRYARI